MAMKLSIGFQKKIGLPDYGSAGANCQVEFEIDVGPLKDNLDVFYEKARHAFAACQQAVNDQLVRQNQNGSPKNGNGHGSTNGSNGNGSGHSGRAPRLATQSQSRAIRAIASKQRLDLQNLLKARFGVGNPENLRLSDASALIDDLKGTGDGHR